MLSPPPKANPEEEKKYWFLRSGRKLPPPTGNARVRKTRQGCVCHTSDTTKQNAVSLLGVPKSAEKTLRLFYYTAKGAVCQAFSEGLADRISNPCLSKRKAPTEADGGIFRKRVDNAWKMWYDKNTREHRRRLLPSAMVKDNRSELEAEGGYLFLCCAMYSNRRFRAKTIATNPSCRFMSITSFLSEGEKTCSLRKSGRSNRHRQATPASAKRGEGVYAIRLTQQNRTLFHCSVFPSSQRKLCGFSIIRQNFCFVKFFRRVAHKKRRFGYTASKNGNGGGKA